MKWLFILSIVFCLNSAQSASIMDRIADSVKTSVSHVEGEELQTLMKNQFRQMWLMDDEGQWQIKGFNKINDQLIPLYSSQDVSSFIDNIAKSNAKNEYLMDFLDSIDGKNIGKLEEYFNRDASEIMPHVLAYALALDNLTKAMRQDHKLLHRASKHWKKMRKDNKLRKKLTLGYKIKLFSIEKPLEKIMKVHTKGKVPKKLLKQIVSINILEAGLFELAFGHKDNWKTARILAKYNPNGREAKKLLGKKKAQTRWSDDKKAIVLGLPIAEKWADLYSVWQMAFVTQHKHFPFALTKLIIPSVADHYGKSGEYIYNRGIALYTSLHYSFMGRKIEGVTNYTKTMDWEIPRFTTLFGVRNLINAKVYRAAVKLKSRNKK